MKQFRVTYSFRDGSKESINIWGHSLLSAGRFAFAHCEKAIAEVRLYSDVSEEIVEISLTS